MDNNKKRKNLIIAGCLIGAGIIFLLVAANMASDWRYYLSDEYNSTANTVKYCGWGSVLVGAIVAIAAVSGSAKATMENGLDPKKIYAEGMYYLGEPKTFDNIGAAYRCFIKIPDYEDAKWKAMECRRMLEAMEAEQEQK